MKRYGYLYQDVCSMENLRLAHQNARAGKSHYHEVKIVDARPEKSLLAIQQMLVNKTFQNAPYTTFTRSENGKTREIYRLPYYPDRIIHHAIMNVVKPIWKRVFIRDTYSAIEGRGIHDGVRRMQQALRGNQDATRYCLKMDVRKFYPSMDHQVLKQILRKKIKDPNLLWLLGEIIDSTAGVPIGNYLSQYFGNLYLAYFDHWMKENQSVAHYYRYCDDMVTLSESKSWLHILRSRVAEYLSERLGLQVKENWQVFPVASRGIDFLGYVFYHGYTLLRKSIKERLQRKVALIKQHWQCMSPTTIVNRVMSYWGWLKHCDARHLWKSILDSELRKIMDMACHILGIRNPIYAM